MRWLALIALAACGHGQPVAPPAPSPVPLRFHAPGVLEASREPEDPLLPRATEVLTFAQLGALEKLWDDAVRGGTVALVVVHKSKTLVDVQLPWTEQGHLYSLHSITKMFTAFAIGALLADGQITLDEPLWRFFPEWREGAKAGATIEHLLRHTSGLPHVETTQALYAASNRVAYARALPLETAPGTRFAYSNEGVELLSAVVQATAGVSLSDFVRDRVLTPLGIQHFKWWADGAHATNAYAGLMLGAHDLARVGEMLLHDGTWQGARVLPEGWVSRMTSPTVPWENWRYGLLTVVFPDPSYRDAQHAIAFGHAGSGYQYLFVAPRSNLVIVRFRNRQEGDDSVPFAADMVRVADAFR